MWLAVGVAVQAALHRWWPGALVLDGSWRLLGLVPLAAGIALALWGQRQFAKAGTGLVPGTEITTFVRSGPYRFTRNPMYLGMTIALVGVALLFGSLTGLLVPPAFMFVIKRNFIRHEEAMLRHAFGDEAWTEYSRSTRRWI
jgi:protein-S-isoprenylcysteine O-methyltransferase Ste14